ncbi:MAG TPA: cation:proton antiporter [Candidatus Polarisedimenticolia bacterium]|nr:cation:proton antiporter [Candidatus Polarisedimenticolia bacterium]
MHSEVDLIGPLVLLLAVACLVVLVLNRLRLPPTIGYLLSGVLLGPHVLGLLGQSETVSTVAEIGVILLMFTIGLEFDARYFLRIRRVALGAGLTQILMTILAALLAGMAFGWSIRTSLFVGCIIALSSTAIVLKSLMQQGAVDTLPGRLTVAVLILQDLAIVPMMILLSIPGGTTSEISLNLAGAVARATVLLVMTFVLSRYLMPRFLHLTAAGRSKELFLLVTMAICLGMAWVSHLLGVSYALGAFLAGVIIGGTEFAHQTTSDIIPFRDVFSGVFFVAMGMLLDPPYVASAWPAVLVLVAIILIGKTVITTLAVAGFGYPPAAALQVGYNLAQVGEFSFLIAQMGGRQNLIGEEIYKLAIASSVISMMVAPLLIQVSPRLAAVTARLFSGILPGLDRLARASAGIARVVEPPPLSNHVVILGYGTVGRTLGEVLLANKVPFLALELDPDYVRDCRRHQHPVHYGDASSEALMRRVGVDRARFLVVTVPDTVMERAIISRARAMNPGLFILARSRRGTEDENFYLDGADEVVAETFEAGIEFMTRILRRLNVPKQEVERQVAVARGRRYEIFRRADLSPLPLSDVRRTLDSLRVEFLAISSDSPLVGRSLRDAGIRESTGALVMAVVRDGQINHSPGADFTLQTGDTILVSGAIEQVARVEAMIDRGVAAD